jgi:predicted metal-dependent hydrolase
MEWKETWRDEYLRWNCGLANAQGGTLIISKRRWYGERLQEFVPTLLDKWQAKLGVTADTWGKKKMKTKWGSCNAEARRISLNRDLVRKPLACLEYVVVHELVHLVVRHHDERFFAMMDRHLPKWRAIRKLLNAEPLGHAEWGE